MKEISVDVEPEYASVEDLLGSADLPERLVRVRGGAVRVRGLSRHALFFNGKGTEDNTVIEARNLVSCMVNPTMTLAQAEAWMRKASAGDIGKIQTAIRELSGLVQGADKSDLA